MTGPPKLEGADRGDENVECQSGRLNDDGSKTAQRHYRNVPGRAGMADGRIEESNYTDGYQDERELRIIHSR